MSLENVSDRPLTHVSGCAVRLAPVDGPGEQDLRPVLVGVAPPGPFPRFRPAMETVVGFSLADLCCGCHTRKGRESTWRVPWPGGLCQHFPVRE